MEIILNPLEDNRLVCEWCSSPFIHMVTTRRALKTVFWCYIKVNFNNKFKQMSFYKK